MAHAKEALANVIDAARLYDDPATLEAYSRDHSFAPPKKPQLVIKVQTADEVQAIVKWANQTHTALVPVSSGTPRSRGDTIPTADEAVVIDLSGMKKIIRADRRNRMTIIEPGVTFGELKSELAKAGLKPSMPLLPRQSKSVVASLLEREPITVPKYQWVLLEPLRCLELVWGNGDRMATGEAYDRGTLEEQWQKKMAQMIATGPGQVDYYRLVSAAQGGMGIVTWASVKCEVLPKVHKLMFIPANRLEDLIDCAYKLVRFRLGDELFILNKAYLASILGSEARQIESLKEKLPAWVIVAGLAGREYLPEERIEYQKKDIADIAREFGLSLVSSLPGVDHPEVLLNPSPEPYWKTSYKGSFQDIFFLTTLDKTPGFMKTVNLAAGELKYPLPEIGVYLQPVHQGVGCHCEFNLPYNPGNQKEVAMVNELHTTASQKLVEQGAFFSRPYGVWADMAYNRDKQAATMLKKIKGIFDPNNVMNPGKLCIPA